MIDKIHHACEGDVVPGDPTFFIELPVGSVILGFSRLDVSANHVVFATERIVETFAHQKMFSRRVCDQDNVIALHQNILVKWLLVNVFLAFAFYISIS